MIKNEIVYNKVVDYNKNQGWVMVLENCYEEGGIKKGCSTLHFNIFSINDEESGLCCDTNYLELWDTIRLQLGLSITEAYKFNFLTYGDNLFERDFQGNINPELSAVIRDYNKIS